MRQGFPSEIPGIVLQEQSVPTEKIHGVAEVAGAVSRFTLEQPQDPADITDPTPLLAINGYGGVKSAYTHFRHYVAAFGRKPAVTFEPPGSQSLGHFMDRRHHARPELLLPMMAGRVMRTLGFDAYDVSGHSMGGPAGANLALHRPDQVRNLFLVASAGVGDHDIWQLAKRARHFGRDEMLDGLGDLLDQYSALGLVKQELRYFSPLYRRVREGLTVAGSDIRPQLIALRATGVRVVNISMPADRLFPPELEHPDLEMLVDVYSRYPDDTAGHAAPQRQPRHVAQHHLDLLGSAPVSQAA